MSALQIIPGYTDDAKFSVTAVVDTSEYDPELEYRVNFSITDRDTKKIIHQDQEIFKRGAEVSLPLYHAIDPKKEERKLMASARVFQRASTVSPWEPTSDELQKDYDLFGSAKSLKAPDIELRVAFGHGEEGTPYLRVEAKADIRVNDGYGLVKVFDNLVECEYFVSGATSVKLQGRSDGKTVLFDWQKVDYRTGGSSYFIIKIGCVAHDASGMMMPMIQITDSREYS